MIVRIRLRTVKQLGFSLLLGVLILNAIATLSLLTPSVNAVNITNQTVLARVNVSNSPPFLYEVYITEPDPIDLIAGTQRIVTCNGSYSDSSGFDDVLNVTATLYHHKAGAGAADDNIDHYTNLSCGTCSVEGGTGGLNGTCSCNFPVEYYAQNGSWFCNMTISDAFFNVSENSSSFRISETVGIDVESAVLDYGNMSATQVSDFLRENVTNIGNVPINVTLRGYGSDNETVGQNFTMLCESGSNITFENHRFTLNNGTAFGDMTNLSNQTRQIDLLTVPNRITNGGLGNSSNSTYWKLRVPFGVSGICNGTVIFGAIQDYTLF